MVIYGFRANKGQEKLAARLIANKAAKSGAISCILVPENLSGYIFVETRNLQDAEEIIRDVRPIRRKHAVGGRSVPIEELADMLVPRSSVEGIGVGDIVEVIDGPFKRTKARIIKVEKEREEVTFELLDADIPIPVKHHADYVRVLESVSSESADSEE